MVHFARRLVFRGADTRERRELSDTGYIRLISSLSSMYEVITLGAQTRQSLGVQVQPQDFTCSDHSIQCRTRIGRHLVHHQEWLLWKSAHECIRRLISHVQIVVASPQSERTASLRSCFVQYTPIAHVRPWRSTGSPRVNLTCLCGPAADIDRFLPSQCRSRQLREEAG